MFVMNLFAMIGFFTVIFYLLGKYSNYKKAREEEKALIERLEREKQEEIKKEQEEKKYEEEYRKMMKLTNGKYKMEDDIIEKQLIRILGITIAKTKTVVEDPFDKDNNDKIIYGNLFLNDFSVEFLYFGGMDTILEVDIEEQLKKRKIYYDRVDEKVNEGELKEKVIYNIVNNNSYYIVCYYCYGKSSERIYFLLKKKN